MQCSEYDNLILALTSWLLNLYHSQKRARTYALPSNSCTIKTILPPQCSITFTTLTFYIYTNLVTTSITHSQPSKNHKESRSIHTAVNFLHNHTYFTTTMFHRLRHKHSHLPNFSAVKASKYRGIVTCIGRNKEWDIPSLLQSLKTNLWAHV